MEGDVVVRILFTDFLHDFDDCLSLHADSPDDEVNVHRGPVLNTEDGGQEESALEDEPLRIGGQRKSFQEVVEEIPRVNDVRADAFLLRDASRPRGERIPVNPHNPLPPESDTLFLPPSSSSRI